MPRGRPVDDATRDRARELIRAGRGRNEVAKELSLSGAVVSGIAKAAGLSFDRSATAVAVQAASVDRAARRGAIIDRLYSRSEHVLSRLEAEEYVYTVAIPGKGAETVRDDDPPARDEKDLAAAIGGYLTQAAKLELVDQDGGQAAAVSVVDGLMQAFKGAVALLPDPVAVTESTPNSV